MGWRDQLAQLQQESPLDWAGIHRGEMRNIREMDKAGMSLLPGTDAGAPLVVPGFSLHDELGLLVRAAGLTPAQAVEAATAKSARVAGLGDSLGSIDHGKIADFVLLTQIPCWTSRTRNAFPPWSLTAGFSIERRWIGCLPQRAPAHAGLVEHRLCGNRERMACPAEATP